MDLPCTFCTSHPAMLSYMMPDPFGPARTLQLPPWSWFSGSIQQHQQGQARAEPKFQGRNVATLVKIVVHCVVITLLVRATESMDGGYAQVVALCCILLLKAPNVSPKEGGTIHHICHQHLVQAYCMGNGNYLYSHKASLVGSFYIPYAWWLAKGFQYV